VGWSGVGTDPTWPRGQRIPVSREGHVTGKSGHASTCSGGSDDAISSAGAGGGALLRSAVPARGPGQWERTRTGTSWGAL